MKRFSGSMSVVTALLALSAFAASGAEAKPKMKRHHAPNIYQPVERRPAAFPTYVDRGSDRNPGGDNLYFTDTKDPHYIVGPAWFQRWEDR